MLRPLGWGREGQRTQETWREQETPALAALVQGLPADRVAEEGMERKGRGGESRGGRGGATGYLSWLWPIGFSVWSLHRLHHMWATHVWCVVMNISEHVHSCWAFLTLSRDMQHRPLEAIYGSRPQQSGGCPCPQFSDKEAELG